MPLQMDDMKRPFAVYVMLGLKDVARISKLSFPASINKAADAQQLSRSVKAAMSAILMRSDPRCRAYDHPHGYPVGTSHSIKRSCVP